MILGPRGIKVLLYLRYVDDINIVVKNMSWLSKRGSLRPDTNMPFAASGQRD